MNTPIIPLRLLCALALVLLLPGTSACAYHGGYGGHLGYAGHSGGHSSVHLGLSYDHPGYYGGYYRPYYGIQPRIIFRDFKGHSYRGHHGFRHHGHGFKHRGHGFKHHGPHYRGFKHRGFKARGFGHRRH